MTFACDGLTAVLFREGGKWIAQALERDIAAQGDTVGEAKRRLALTIQYERTDVRFESIEAAPKVFWDMTQ